MGQCGGTVKPDVAGGEPFDIHVIAAAQHTGHGNASA
jgi:hypothetical protein